MLFVKDLFPPGDMMARHHGEAQHPALAAASLQRRGGGEEEGEEGRRGETLTLASSPAESGSLVYSLHEPTITLPDLGCR